MHIMKLAQVFLTAALLGSPVALHAQLDTASCTEILGAYKPLPAPKTSGLLLQKGDRLAIIGDSITEQKMYSRIMETYLTVALPELEITARQYGWSGETAPGFASRMTNDCLRFKPTIATTCYGMNDHGYRPYEASIGDRYREVQTRIVRSFRDHGMRVVLGSAGSVGKVPTWTKSEAYTKEQLNLNLLELRNIDVQIAEQEKVSFADVFWPMITQDCAAKAKYGPDYCVPGKDGVHPGWAGQVVMAYAFLKGLGVQGDIGTYTIDLGTKTATASTGHQVLSFADNQLEVKSSRYPFCIPAADTTKDDTLASGMTLVPFQQDLNRLVLKVTHAPAERYKVTWGAETHSFTRAQLETGINLAAEFVNNPFVESFNRVDQAVAAKQNYETRQIKMLFHGEEGHAAMEDTVALTEKVRTPLANNIRAALTPVQHKLVLAAE